MSNEISIKINLNDYPLLDNFKKKDLDKILQNIFNTGYKIHFPSMDERFQKIEFNQLKNSIESLRDIINEKTDINDKILEKFNSKIEPLNSSLERLIGLQTTSSKKGELAENVIEKLFTSRYGDIKYEKKNNISHCGDAWIHLSNNKIIMIESKNYSKPVSKDEIDKMEFDMKHNNINYGLFLSMNSGVCNFKDMDLHTFYNYGKPYFIIIISNVSSELSKLDLGFSIIKQLSILNDTKEFPWIQKNIKDNLFEINSLVDKNHLLRTNYETMEKTIYSSLETYYITLRDYQYELEQTIKKLTNDINSTVQESIYKFQSNQYLLDNFKDNKTFPIMIHIIDILDNKKLKLEKQDEKSKNKYVIFNKDKNIGSLDLTAKKITIKINPKNEITFNITTPKENNQNFVLLENYLS